MAKKNLNPFKKKEETDEKSKTAKSNPNKETEKKYPVLLVITPTDEKLIKVRVTLTKPLVPVLSLDELLVTNASIKENSLIVDETGLIYEVDLIPTGKEIIEFSLLTTFEGDLIIKTIEDDEDKKLETPIVIKDKKTIEDIKDQLKSVPKVNRVKRLRK